MKKERKKEEKKERERRDKRFTEEKGRGVPEHRDAGSERCKRC